MQRGRGGDIGVEDDSPLLCRFAAGMETVFRGSRAVSECGVDAEIQTTKPQKPLYSYSIGKRRSSMRTGSIGKFPDGGNIPNLGDYENNKDDYDGKIDLLVGNSCQAYSVAGLGKDSTIKGRTRASLQACLSN